MVWISSVTFGASKTESNFIYCVVTYSLLYLHACLFSNDGQASWWMQMKTSLLEQGQYLLGKFRLHQIFLSSWGEHRH